MSETYEIRYHISSASGQEVNYSLWIDPINTQASCDLDNPPEWAQLEYQQCKHCQLSDTPYCPIAIRLVEPIQQLKQFKSFNPVNVTVYTPQRNYQKQVDAQEAIRSLFGLIMATSGCPSMKPFRYMARHHLPFSQEEESLQRIISSLLIENWLNESSTKITISELKQRLKEFYQTILTLNEAMAERLKHPDYAESAVNAVVIFSAQSSLIPMMIDKEINDIKKYCAG